MAIKIGGTTVIDDSANITTSVGGFKTVNGTGITGSGDIEAGGSRVLLNRTVMSNTSSYNFTSLNSSLYDNYYVEWHGISPSNGGSSQFDLYLSDDGLTSTDSDIATRITRNEGTVNVLNKSGRVHIAESVSTYNSWNGGNCSGFLTLWNMHSGSDLSSNVTGVSSFMTNGGTQCINTFGAHSTIDGGSNNQNTHDSFKMNFNGGSTNMSSGVIVVYGILK